MRGVVPKENRLFSIDRSRGRSSSGAYTRIVWHGRIGRQISESISTGQHRSQFLSWSWAEAASMLRGTALLKEACEAKLNPQGLPLQTGKLLMRKKKSDFHLPVLTLAFHKTFWPSLCSSEEVSNDSLFLNQSFPQEAWGNTFSLVECEYNTRCTGIPYPHYISL